MSAIFRHQKRRRSDRHFAGMDRYIYGSTKEPTMRELDAKDREILAILSKEARIPLKTLAGRIGLSRSATGSASPILRRMVSFAATGRISARSTRMSFAP